MAQREAGRPVPFARPFKGSESTCEWADLRHELASVFLTLVTLTSASEAKRYYNALLYPSHCPKPAQLKFGTVACGGPGGMTVVEGHFMVKLEGSTGDGTSMSVASLEELATKVFQVAPLVQPR